MKKLLAVLLIAMIAFSAFAGGDKEEAAPAVEKSAVEQAIEKAQSMTLAELEAAAKAELEANPDLTFNADSLT